MAQPVPPFRLASVDVFRGVTMAAMVIVNTPGDWSHVYPPLLHADWHGWTPTDLIFPFFVFIVGVSIVLSGRSAGSVARDCSAARRCSFAIGLGLALYPTFNFATVRVMGVLPRLALCYFAAALVYRGIAGRPDPLRLRVVLAAAGALLVGYWGSVDVRARARRHRRRSVAVRQPGAWLDRTVIGEAHLWRQSKTWDPEGLLSTLPAIATALTGVAAGIVLRSSRRTVDKMLLLAAAGSSAWLPGLAWGTRFPINKNLWTSSYVLLTSGLASVALAACYWAIDGRPREGVAPPVRSCSARTRWRCSYSPACW